MSALKLLCTHLHTVSVHHSCSCPMAYAALLRVVNALSSWLSEVATLLQHSDQESSSDHIWSGEEVLDLFEARLQVTPSSMAMLLEHLREVVAIEEEERQDRLEREEGGGSSSVNVQYEEEPGDKVLERAGERGISNLPHASFSLMMKLFQVLDYMFKDGGSSIRHYKMVVLRQKRGRESDVTLNFW